MSDPKYFKPYNPFRSRRREARPSSVVRGYDRRWRKYRATYLMMNPWCVDCLKQNRYTLAKHVDHIKPVKNGQDDPLFWEPSNHQPLCHSCHSKKTRKE